MGQDKIFLSIIIALGVVIFMMFLRLAIRDEAKEVIKKELTRLGLWKDES